MSKAQYEIGQRVESIYFETGKVLGIQVDPFTGRQIKVRVALDDGTVYTFKVADLV